MAPRAIANGRRGLMQLIGGAGQLDGTEAGLLRKCRFQVGQFDQCLRAGFDVFSEHFEEPGNRFRQNGAESRYGSLRRFQCRFDIFHPRDGIAICER